MNDESQGANAESFLHGERGGATTFMEMEADVMAVVKALACCTSPVTMCALATLSRAGKEESGAWLLAWVFALTVDMCPSMRVHVLSAPQCCL